MRARSVGEQVTRTEFRSFHCPRVIERSLLRSYAITGHRVAIERSLLRSGGAPFRKGSSASSYAEYERSTNCALVGFGTEVGSRIVFVDLRGQCGHRSFRRNLVNLASVQHPSL